jgi:PAS domain-containing protein
VEKGERPARKKYESPTVTPIPFTRLSPKARGELAHLVSASVSEPTRITHSDSGCWFVLDAEGRFKQASGEFGAALGYRNEALLGKRINRVTTSRTVHIPQHLGAVVHFMQVHCLWMFVHRDGHAVLVRSDWELLPNLSMEVFCELLAGSGRNFAICGLP